MANQGVFRLFISSTFSDMKLERSLLHHHVFPKITKLCESFNAIFTPIDLRWGINEQTQIDHQTMDVCIHEIKRCQAISPMPNFLILLGDRYGWEPLLNRIDSKAFEALLPILGAEDQALLLQWFQQDLNASPSEYVLQSKTGIYLEYEAWCLLEKKLLYLLREAVITLKQEHHPAYQKLFLSATHQEIIQGLFTPSPINEPEKHVIACLRTIQNLDRSQSNSFYDEHPEQIAKLKQDIKEQIKDPKLLFEYQAHIQNTGNLRLDEASFCESIYQSLESMIRSQLMLKNESDPLKEEIAAQKSFRDQRISHFFGRQDELSHLINQYYHNESQIPCVVLGIGGLGKSSFMAQLSKNIEKNPQELVIYRFIGASSHSTRIKNLLLSILQELSEKLEISLDLNLDLSGLKNTFQQLLKSSKKSVTILVDAIDQLMDSEYEKTSWIPEKTHKRAKLIISSLPELKGNFSHFRCYELPTLSAQDSHTIVQAWLNQHQRCLQPNQMAYLLQCFEKNGTALYLKLIFEQAIKWHSYDPLPVLPTSTKEIIDLFFDTLEKKHNPQRDRVITPLLQRIIRYLLMGRYGFTEYDLLGLSVKNKYFIDQLQSTMMHPLPNQQLPLVIWSRIYMDLEPYLGERYDHGDSLMVFFHREFTEVLRKRYLSDEQLLLEQYEDICQYYQHKKTLIQLEPKRLMNQRKISEFSYALSFVDFKKYINYLTNPNYLFPSFDLGLYHMVWEDYQKAMDRFEAHLHLFEQAQIELFNQLFDLIQSNRELFAKKSHYHHINHLIQLASNQPDTQQLSQRMTQWVNEHAYWLPFKGYFLKRPVIKIDHPLINRFLIQLDHLHDKYIKNIYQYNDHTLIIVFTIYQKTGFIFYDLKHNRPILQLEDVEDCLNHIQGNYAFNDPSKAFWDLDQRIFYRNTASYFKGQPLNQWFKCPHPNVALLSTHQQKLFLWDMEKCQSLAAYDHSGYDIEKIGIANDHILLKKSFEPYLYRLSTNEILPFKKQLSFFDGRVRISKVYGSSDLMMYQTVQELVIFDSNQQVIFEIKSPGFHVNEVALIDQKHLLFFTSSLALYQYEISTQQMRYSYQFEEKNKVNDINPIFDHIIFIKGQWILLFFGYQEQENRSVKKQIIHIFDHHLNHVITEKVNHPNPYHHKRTYHFDIEVDSSIVFLSSALQCIVRADSFLLYKNPALSNVDFDIDFQKYIIHDHLIYLFYTNLVYCIDINIHKINILYFNTKKIKDSIYVYQHKKIDKKYIESEAFINHWVDIPWCFDKRTQKVYSPKLVGNSHILDLIFLEKNYVFIACEEGFYLWKLGSEQTIFVPAENDGNYRNAFYTDQKQLIYITAQQFSLYDLSWLYAQEHQEASEKIEEAWLEKSFQFTERINGIRTNMIYIQDYLWLRKDKKLFIFDIKAKQLKDIPLELEINELKKLNEEYVLCYSQGLIMIRDAQAKRLDCFVDIGEGFKDALLLKDHTLMTWSDQYLNRWKLSFKENDQLPVLETGHIEGLLVLKDQEYLAWSRYELQLWDAKSLTLKTRIKYAQLIGKVSLYRSHLLIQFKQADSFYLKALHRDAQQSNSFNSKGMEIKGKILEIYAETILYEINQVLKVIDFNAQLIVEYQVYEYIKINESSDYLLFIEHEPKQLMLYLWKNQQKLIHIPARLSFEKIEANYQISQRVICQYPSIKGLLCIDTQTHQSFIITPPKGLHYRMYTINCLDKSTQIQSRYLPLNLSNHNASQRICEIWDMTQALKIYSSPHPNENESIEAYSLKDGYCLVHRYRVNEYQKDQIVVCRFEELQHVYHILPFSHIKQHPLRFNRYQNKSGLFIYDFQANQVVKIEEDFSKNAYYDYHNMLDQYTYIIHDNHHISYINLSLNLKFFEGSQRKLLLEYPNQYIQWAKENEPTMVYSDDQGDSVILIDEHGILMRALGQYYEYIDQIDYRLHHFNHQEVILSFGIQLYCLSLKELTAF